MLELIAARRRLASILAAVLATAATAELGPQFRGFRMDGQGRTGTASIDGVDALFLNPAGLAGLRGNGFQVSGNMGLNAVLLDYAKWAADNYSYLNTIDSLLLKIEPIQNKWAPFSNSFLAQGHYQDFAISMVQDIRYDLSLSKAVITPVPGVGMLSDFQLAAGRGFSPRPEWKVGFAMKYLYRLRFRNRLVGTTDEEFYKVKAVLQRPANSLGEQIDKIGVAQEVAEAGQGFGINMGAMRMFDKGFSAGFSLLDFPTFYNGGFLFPQMNLGGGYAKDFEMLEGLNHRVVVNLDWQVPFSWEPWFKQWKMGTALEGRMGNRVVSVTSLGFNDGYPAFGLRVGYLLYFSYLYIAEETGSYPGQRKLSFHKIGLDFGF